MAQRVYPVPRLIEFLSQGLSSKNSRTRVECTEVLCDILAMEGLSVFERSKEKPFPAVAQARTSTMLIQFCNWPGRGHVKDSLRGVWHGRSAPWRATYIHVGHHAAQMVSERDKGVRAAALNLLEKLYLLTGSATTWALLGQLTPQQHSLIEERLKYKDKQDAPSASAYGSSTSSVNSWWADILPFSLL